MSIETVFFCHIPDTYILSLSFLSADVQQSLRSFDKNMDFASEGKRQFAKSITPELNEKGKAIGYDIVGLDSRRRALGSFRVHGYRLLDPFGVKINQLGLLNDETNREEIMEFMNDPESHEEPEPWYWAKVKLF